jgi:transglutaminase-like putative cysteine protease
VNAASPRAPGGWALRGVTLAALGSLALGGGTGPIIGGVAGLAMLLPAPRVPRWAWPWVHGLVLAVTSVLALLTAPTGAFALLVAWLLVHRSWTGRGADDMRVALLLSTLLLLLGSVGTDTVYLAPVFVLFGALLPIALLRAELHDVGEAAPRRLEVGVAIGSSLVAGLLFLALPRLDGGYLGGRNGAHERFPDDVTLGAEGLVSDDGAEVMRIRVTRRDGLAVPGPFHVRGRALDRFDGTRWVAAGTTERVDPKIQWDRRTEVWLEPMGGDLVFGVPELLKVDGVVTRREPGGAYVTRGGVPARHYVTYGHDVPLAAIDVTDADAWLQLPALDPRVTALAWSVAGEEADPAKVARALDDWLGSTYTYVDTPPPPVGDPLAWFLFDSRQGHCEYFASALAVMLRIRGIPARLATGFHSGELDDDGTIVVRRGNAHAWVEVRTKAGWATLDPTPDDSLPALDTDSLGAHLDAFVAGWYRGVVEYDMDAQFTAFGALGRRVPFIGDAGQSPTRTGLVGMLVVLGGLVTVLVMGRLVLLRLGSPRRAGPPRDALGRLVLQARTVVRRRGWVLPPELPLLAAAEWLEARVGPDARPLARLAELVYASRYGGAPVATALPEAQACVRALRRLPRPRVERAFRAAVEKPSG